MLISDKINKYMNTDKKNLLIYLSQQNKEKYFFMNPFPLK